MGQESSAMIEVEKSLKIIADYDAWLRDFLRKEQEK